MPDAKLQQDRDLLAAAEAKGAGAKFAAYFKLSGPGWLQSAITLGGGSLAGSLYIGVIGGYKMLWLQPVMMILGIIMLSAIAYVTLSTGEKPFRSINKHINPVLGWGWLFAAMIANLVWAMPQFSLGTAAMQQNLGMDWLPDWGCVAIIFVIAGVVIWFYDAGGWGIKLFELVLKVMVGLIVLAFFGVVAALAFKGSLPWAEVFGGFVPDFSLLSQPAENLRPYVAASSDPAYWSGKIVGIQRNTMIAAAATAVGINMTFLLPYSMLRKGWDRTFRGLATFDLSTGLFIPFVLATSCVVIAAASQFHAKYDPGLVGEADPTAVTESLQKGYDGNLKTFLATPRVRGTGSDKPLTIDKRWESERNPDSVNDADRQLAAMTIKSDSGALALSLENVTGSKAVAQYVFGFGVAAMAVSTLIILMLINGFTFTEALGAPTSGVMHRVGSYLPAFTGAFGFMFLWSKYPEARFWLAIPTSRIGMMLLPVAYITFFMMMNSRKLMGDNLMTGGKRIAANAVMLLAIAVATYGCGLSLWMSTMKIPGTEQSVRPFLMALAGGFVALAVVVQILRKPATEDAA